MTYWNDREYARIIAMLNAKFARETCDECGKVATDACYKGECVEEENVA